MAKNDSLTAAPPEPAVSERDILFECPSCGKSLVVDESAEGMIIDCPQCDTNVIVPPRAVTPAEEPGPPMPVRPTPPASKPGVTTGTVGKKPAEPKRQPAPAPASASAAEPVVADLHDRLTDLSGKLREVQTQWADTTNRIATRINDVNRELVTLSRLEIAHKELLQEWNGLIGRLAKASEEVTRPLPQPPRK